MNFFCALLYHDMRLHVRRMMEWVVLVLFFIIVILLLPFTLGPDPALLQRLSPGIVWLAALLMGLLALERLFVQDERDGTLDLMLLSPHPLPLIVLSKIAAQAAMMVGALLLMLGPAALLLNMSAKVIPILMVTLILGVPVLVLLGGVIGAMTVMISRGTALLTLLLIPFYVPVLIFAVAACDAAALDMSPATPLLFMGAFLAFLLPAAPFVIAFLLRSQQG